MTGRRIIWMVCACAVALATAAGCSVIRETPQSSDAQTQEVVVDPQPESENSETQLANLYFGYKNKQLLVCETREISVPVNERNEIAVLKALIKGPGNANADYTKVINAQTKVVDVTENAGYLFVTLSKEFLLPPQDFDKVGMGENVRRYLAACSVINTLVEQGGYARIQLLVDRDDSGSGTPLVMSEMGLEGEDYAEPRGRNGEIILNSRNTLREIMSALEMKDWNRLYGFVAYQDAADSERPSLEEFKNKFTENTLTVSRGEVLDKVWQTDPQEDKILITYTIRIGEGEPQNKSNVPVTVIRENDMWKIQYSELVDVFLNAE